MDPLTVYIIDTSSLVTLHQWRPPRNNRAVWQSLDRLIGDARLIAPQQVYEELTEGGDALSRWAMRRKKEGLFRKTTRQHAGIAKEIIHRFPDFVERDRPDTQADPFVVALARHECETQLGFQQNVVVTEEKFTPTGRSRIPHVCAAYGLRYLSIHQMYVSEGWAL